LAQKRKDDFQVVLSRYAVERFLVRLSRSEFAERFIVKGASLFFLWLPEMSYLRVTRDLDLLGWGRLGEEELESIVCKLCELEMEVDDGLVFDQTTVATRAIRPENRYGGVRVTLEVRLLNIRIPLQIDVGWAIRSHHPPSYPNSQPCFPRSAQNSVSTSKKQLSQKSFMPWWSWVS
jgi:hypothetical protein